MAKNSPPDCIEPDGTRERNLERAQATLAELNANVEVEAMRVWLSTVAKGEFDAFRYERSDR